MVMFMGPPIVSLGYRTWRAVSALSPPPLPLPTRGREPAASLLRPGHGLESGTGHRKFPSPLAASLVHPIHRGRIRDEPPETPLPARGWGRRYSRSTPECNRPD